MYACVSAALQQIKPYLLPVQSLNSSAVKECHNGRGRGGGGVEGRAKEIEGGRMRRKYSKRGKKIKEEEWKGRKRINTESYFNTHTFTLGEWLG